MKPPCLEPTCATYPSNLSEVDISQLQLRSHLRNNDFPTSTNVPESARNFFASVSSPTGILSSKLIRKAEGIGVIEGGYNFVHILDLDTGDSGHPFRFVLRFPIEPGTVSRWQTYTAVGSMLYCQRHPDLNIPTPAVYAYNCTYGSEFIAMEYIDGDTLSDVWLDLPEEEKENVLHEVARILRSMRATRFSVIGGISPDGSPCPLVDNSDVTTGVVFLDDFGLYNAGPYKSVQEYVQSVFDREYHFMDHLLHKNTLPNAEEAKNEICRYLQRITIEEAFERVKRKRQDFIERPYDCTYPIVLRHGDLEGRNIIVSRSSPRRILSIIDWDFAGSHALPLADDVFEPASPDSDQNVDVRMKQGDDLYQAQLRLYDLAGVLPHDGQLINLLASTQPGILDSEAGTVADKDKVVSVELDVNNLN